MKQIKKGLSAAGKTRRPGHGPREPSCAWLKGLQRPVSLKRFDCASTYEPVGEEVQLINCNPHYAHVRFPGGKALYPSVISLLVVIAHVNDFTRTSSNEDNGVHAPPLSDLHTPPLNDIGDNIDHTPVSPPCPGTAPASPDTYDPSISDLARLQQRTRPYILRNRQA
ncbi:hypothetical protein T265_00768 [Opisthorchis viverrini]|uniref:Uncharacterized protein n=1 Tax=Opisthorchis viverrini TaxID=6198 RepID=A0A075A0N5_OPIVI|nr:hypothetical protein T265_00768 [Opisthorchis viverrini]KER33258.1 hypothetical protein T265_00768 [Opisthorchis viverrini]